MQVMLWSTHTHTHTGERKYPHQQYFAAPFPIIVHKYTHTQTHTMILPASVLTYYREREMIGIYAYAPFFRQHFKMASYHKEKVSKHFFVIMMN